MTKHKTWANNPIASIESTLCATDYAQENIQIYYEVPLAWGRAILEKGDRSKQKKPLEELQEFPHCQNGMW